MDVYNLREADVRCPDAQHLPVVCRNKLKACCFEQDKEQWSWKPRSTSTSGLLAQVTLAQALAKVLASTPESQTIIMNKTILQKFNKQYQPGFEQLKRHSYVVKGWLIKEPWTSA
jgi:hypothetical protein